MSAAVRHAVAPAGVAAATPELLAAVRRADWRFLLPDPGLGRVACLAPHDPALVAALRAAGAAVDLLDAPAPRAYDVVVLTGGLPEDAGGAAALLRSGGWLCAEVGGPATRAWVGALRDGGFDEVAAHWLWPEARHCREIVPLEREALCHAFGRRDPGARLRLRARLAALLARAGLFHLAARSAVVIGRLP